MKNEFKEAELSCAEAKEALASARDLEDEELPAIHESPFLNGESVTHRQWKSSCQTLDCVSRQAFAGGEHSNSYIQIGDEMVCLLKNLMEMTARSCVASRVFHEINVKMIRNE